MMVKDKKPKVWSYTTRVYDLAFGQVRISRIGTGSGTVEGIHGLLTLQDLTKYVADLQFVLESET